VVPFKIKGGVMDESQCIFCKIGKGEIPSKKVYEDENTLAFLDINPRNPGHTLVIPKKHIPTILDASEKDIMEIAKTLRKIAEGVKNAMNCDGISIVQNNGIAAGQVVPHIHFHVIPRFKQEGPVSLEAVLQVKKMDENTMNAVMEKIKNGIAQEGNENKSEESNSREVERKEEISFDF